MDIIEQPKVRHKSFTYKTDINWLGGRGGTLRSEGKPPLRVSSPPEFKGEPGVWTPEDLLVAAVEACHMATFIAFAVKKQLPLISYESQTSGTLEFLDGHYRFTRIVVAPTIVVGNTATEADVHALMQESHRHCIVANSITAVVELNLRIIIQ